jgi:hypothetical protein
MKKIQRMSFIPPPARTPQSNFHFDIASIRGLSACIFQLGDKIDIWATMVVTTGVLIATFLIRQGVDGYLIPWVYHRKVRPI